MIRNLGYRVINAINQVSVVTPYALVACVLLANLEKNDFLMNSSKRPGKY